MGIRQLKNLFFCRAALQSEENHAILLEIVFLEGIRMEYRMEHDSMGQVKVPADRYWGAQTQRSHENFPIGIGLETMPEEIIRAFGVLKMAAARANHALIPERMTEKKLKAIEEACSRIISGSLSDHFPLVVFQTGSGTQSNMNEKQLQ